jgi:hypothetical protein
MQVKTLPLSPTRFCKKKIGPLEFKTMARDIIGIIQINNSVINRIEIAMSKNLLAIK